MASCFTGFYLLDKFFHLFCAPCLEMKECFMWMENWIPKQVQFFAYDIIFNYPAANLWHNVAVLWHFLLIVAYIYISCHVFSCMFFWHSWSEFFVVETRKESWWTLKTYWVSKNHLAQQIWSGLFIKSLVDSGMNFLILLTGQ